MSKAAKAQGWEKRGTPCHLTKQAYKLADRTTEQANGVSVDAEKVENQAHKGEPLSPYELEMLAFEEAVNKRAVVLARHREEIDGPRQLLYEAIKENDLAKAKLAKVTAEAMKTVQDAERRAWGFDEPPEKRRLTVVIERGDCPS